MKKIPKKLKAFGGLDGRYRELQLNAIIAYYGGLENKENFEKCVRFYKKKFEKEINAKRDKMIDLHNFFGPSVDFLVRYFISKKEERDDLLVYMPEMGGNERCIRIVCGRGVHATHSRGDNSKGEKKAKMCLLMEVLKENMMKWEYPIISEQSKENPAYLLIRERHLPPL